MGRLKASWYQAPRKNCPYGGGVEGAKLQSAGLELEEQIRLITIDLPSGVKRSA